MKSTRNHSGEIAYTVGRCSLGVVVVASSAKGVCAILLGDSQRWSAVWISLGSGA